MAALAVAGPGPMASGRTDRGVHARCQPVSVRLSGGHVARSRSSSLGGDGWGVAAAVPAPDGFHAQWSSTWKEYRYRLSTDAVPAAWSGLVWETGTHPRLAGRAVDLARGAVGAGARGGDARLLSAPRGLERPPAEDAAGASPGRSAAAWWRCGLRGDAFGRYGVRLLVGGAVLVGAGLVEAETWERALDTATPFEGLRAPAAALTLWAVGYPRRPRPLRGRGARDAPASRPSCRWIRPEAARRTAAPARRAWPGRRRWPRAGTRSAGCGWRARGTSAPPDGPG